MKLSELEGAEQLVTKDYLDTRLAELELRIERSLREQLKWMILLVAPNWLGFVGILIAIYLRK